MYGVAEENLGAFYAQPAPLKREVLPEHCQRGGRVVFRRVQSHHGSDAPGRHGGDHTVFLDEMQHLLTGTRGSLASSLLVATILFTDLVDSTSQAASMGDARWQDVQQQANSTSQRTATSSASPCTWPPGSPRGMHGLKGVPGRVAPLAADPKDR